MRASGILLHPTSLPSAYGIGDLGTEAYQFIDFLVAAKQTYWQVLPLGQTGYGDSPYQCFSAFAGNIYLISSAKLREDGFLSDADLEDLPEFPSGRVDFGKVIDFKLPLLRKAFENFRRIPLLVPLHLHALRHCFIFKLDTGNHCLGVKH